ncbi:hypothetical protein [Pseudomonas sp. Pseu.R1]|uniref:hypothetical protein n=1 Tax=Pseudomonas sp. Pseu.R1 TaxID=3379818 RepID=UPI003B937150
MISNDVSSSNPIHDQNDDIYLQPIVYEKIADLIRPSPYAAQVMLTLMMMIDKKGAVNTTQAVVAHRCNITLQNVEWAIRDLTSAELIVSVDVSSEPGGPFACLLNPDLVRGELPVEQVQG